jgi:type I restriction enzyme S subunit
MSRVRLRHVIQVNPGSPVFDRLSAEDELTFLPMEAVWADARLDVSRVRTKAAVLTGYTRFQDGDVLVPKITPTFEAGRSVLIGGLLNRAGAGTTELHVLRPGGSIDPRFLTYVTQSHPFLRLGEAEMYGVAGQKRVPDDFVRDFVVDLPDLTEQRRVADFLDGRLRRIDRLRAAVDRRISRSAERRGAHFQDVVKRSGGPDLTTLDIRGNRDWPALPLSKVLDQLTNGYVGPTRDLLVDEGARYLQSLHIKNGSIDFERRPYFVPETWLAERTRITLRVGDLLLVQTGALGEVALVDERFAGSGCHALLIARPNAARVSSEYLWCLFRSSWGRNLLLREQTGALHPHLEAGKVREVVVPVPSLDTQAVIVKECAEYAGVALGIERASARQLCLLDERRQALITAAVTGQIDVTTARGAE